MMVLFPASKRRISGGRYTGQGSLLVWPIKETNCGCFDVLMITGSTHQRLVDAAVSEERATVLFSANSYKV